MKILSLDGGGIRGLITLRLLCELEQATGKTVPEMFDFFAGTSIGAIMVALFAYRGLSAQHIAEHVLTIEHLDGLLPASFFDNMLGIIQCQPKYQDTQLNAILVELFGDQLLSETEKRVMITGFDLENNRPVLFKSYVHDKYGSLKVADACTISASAPFYFPPHHVDLNRHTDVATGDQPTCHAIHRLWGIDGGVVNNNPADCALIDAIGLGHKCCEILSIGTGYSTPCLDASDSPNWGIIDWFREAKLVRTMMGGNVLSSHYRCQALARNFDHHYLRIDGRISQDHQSLDDKSQQNLDYLKSVGLDWWEQHRDEVLRIIGCNDEQKN